MDAHTIVRAFALVTRLGRLNPEAGTIGPGMLASLVDEAHAVLAAANVVGAVGAIEVMSDHAALIADGFLFRDLLEIMSDEAKVDTFSDVARSVEHGESYVFPGTVDAARLHVHNLVQQTKESLS